MGLSNNMEQEEEKTEGIEHKKFSPFYRFLALFSAICLFLLSMEGYFYLFHPEPDVKLTLADVQKFLPQSLHEPFTSHSSAEVKQVVLDSEPIIKQIANKIVSDSCRTSDSLCQSKALFYFVRDRITYVLDPKFHDKLENPLVTLKTGGADCEDMAVLVAALEKAIGNDARLVFISGHAYAQVRIPDYKDKWLDMETTCKTCGFNQMPSDTLLENREVVDL